MSKRRETSDPRWEGVELPSLYRVLVRVHGEDAALDLLPEAMDEVTRTGRYGEWHAVMRGTQIVGYRRLNPNEWFVQHTESGDVRGPFPTKRHALHAVAKKKATYHEAGVYSTPGHYIFRRDCAPVLNLDPENLS